MELGLLEEDDEKQQGREGIAEKTPFDEPIINEDEGREGKTFQKSHIWSWIPILDSGIGID